MANYMGTTRTNYFRVNDEEKFRETVSRIETYDGDDIYVFTEKGKDGTMLYGFGTYSAVAGLRPARAVCDDVDECWEDDDDCWDEPNPEDAYRALQEVVADNDAIVVEEVGYEKLRYVWASAVIITKAGIKYISMKQLIEEEVRKELGQDAYVLNDEY